MIRTVVIKKILSVALISLLMISVTPVTVLHDLFANHKDDCYSNSGSQNTRIVQAGLHCYDIDFVAEPHFLRPVILLGFSIVTRVTAVYKFYFNTFFYQLLYFFIGQRGPPSYTDIVLLSV